MQNQCFNRNMFGDLPTQRMAQKALPILIKHAQKGHTILLRDLAEKIAPHLTKVNWTEMGFGLDSDHPLRIRTTRQLGIRENTSYYHYCPRCPRNAYKLGRKRNPPSLLGRLQNSPSLTSF